MDHELTLSIIKPDATERNLVGKITDRFEQAGLSIIAQKRLLMTPEQVAAFYYELADKEFYESLVNYMSSGPVVVQVLSGENAIALNRELMGATDPKQAAPGTIRADFAKSIEANSVHGSDSEDSAPVEISFFFSVLELVG